VLSERLRAANRGESKKIMSKRLYHTAFLLLTVFSWLLAGPAEALEQKKVTDVWPLGQRQQYLYYLNGELAGESWMEIREIPRSGGVRLEMVNTVDVDGQPFGARMTVEGKSVAEIDEWGRPVSYELELERPQGFSTMEALFAYPDVEMRIITPDGERETHARYHEESVFLDFVFIGPFDLAFLLDPVNPSATRMKRNYFVPQLEVNILTDLNVDGEEDITLDDGTTHHTVKVRIPAVLTDLWLGADGRVLKAIVASEQLEIRAGKTETP